VLGTYSHAASRVDSAIALPDGRRIQYAEYGDATGAPVVYLHGAPGCRLAAGILNEAAHASRIRLIAPDRPGYGGSDDLPDRTLLDSAVDLTALLDHLELSRVSLMGVSGGAVFAAAAASAMPERLHRVALIGAAAPVEAPGVLAALPLEVRTILRSRMLAPRVGRLWFRLAGIAQMKTPELALSRARAYLSGADSAMLALPEVRRWWLEERAEAHRQGPAAAMHEAGLYLSASWGFDLRAVRAEVKLWHGSEDKLHPPVMARFLANEIPEATLEIVEGAGSFCYVANGADILSWLGG
jgi:pimeloyl-ACP methyl ester carboxylesterase